MQMTTSKVLVFLSVSGYLLAIIAASEVVLVAEFNSNRVSGTVRFSQTDNGDVKISTGNLKGQDEFTINIHKFPVKYIGPMSEVCQTDHVGNIFDPKNAMNEVLDYTSACKKTNHSACAFGDLAGKFGGIGKLKQLSDSYLSLSGTESIFGRSLVIRNSTSNIIACATIKSFSPVKTVVGIFRTASPGIAGTIVLRQSATDPNSDTSVDIDLLLVDARAESKPGLFLTVHEYASKDDKGSCSSTGNVFNPLAKTSCDKRQQSTCPIGDLSAKSGPIEIHLPGTGSSRSFFIDTNLPLSGKNSVVGHSLMISENGRPLICTAILEYQVMEAEVSFEGAQGLNGVIGLKQVSMYEPALVNTSVSDINGVYEDPLPAGESCLTKMPGNFWWNVTGLPQAFDGLTLYGPGSVIFRKLVVKKSGSSKPFCGTVAAKQPTYHLKAVAHFTDTGKDAITGYVRLEQVAFNSSKAFAYLTSMIVNLKYKADSNRKTRGHKWHFHLLPMDKNSSEMQRCMSTKGHYNPYNVYVQGNKYHSTCNSNAPFRCELGDVSGKLGMYTIGSGMIQLTETENYLASWHNVIGRSVVIHAENKGAARITCADVVPDSITSYHLESLHMKNNTATRNRDNFQKIVSEALGIAAWRVADVKFKEVEGCLKYSFLLIDDSKSNLHKAFSVLVDDQPHKLKDFAPSCGGSSNKWQINEGNAAEIVSIVFGIIALIVLIICVIFWLRKKHRDDEQNSKLVTAERGTAENLGHTVESEVTDAPVETRPIVQHEKIDDLVRNDDHERKGSARDYDITTTL